jgi:hypothetical protein
MPMDFAAWFNDEWDDAHRGGFHEAGHCVYGKHLNPDVRISVQAQGGAGEANFHPDDFAQFTPPERYAIAVAGCLAEAKGRGNGGPIHEGQVNDIADQIITGLGGADHAFWVYLTVRGAQSQGESNKFDFRWLEGAPADLQAIRTAVAELIAFLNTPAEWLKVRRRAWKIAMVKESDDVE